MLLFKQPLAPLLFLFHLVFFIFQIPPTFFPAKIYLREFIKQKGGLGGGHKQVRWVIRKSNTLRGIIVCLAIHLSALSIIIANAARWLFQQASLWLLGEALPPLPGAGRQLRNGHCFFRGEPPCCSLKHLNRRNSNTSRREEKKKEAGLRDKQNPPRHKPVPDFLLQPLLGSCVKVYSLIFFF